MSAKVLFTFFLYLSFSPNAVNAKLNSPIDANKCLESNQLDSNKICSEENDYSHPTVLYRDGPGKNNVVQGLTLDVKRRTLYSLHVTGKPEKGVLNRFVNIDGESDLVALDYQMPSSMIGHQGITNIPGTDWLLSSTGEGIDNKGWYISIFKYEPNDAPASLSTIRVFDDGYSKTTSSMPVVTTDSNSLLVRSKKDGHDIIRVYNFRDLNLINVTDIRNEPYAEWQVDDELTSNKYYFQAITADNKFVYLLSGLSGEEHKRLYIYTLDGKLVTKANDITLGENDAIQSGIEEHWEPEGMTVDSKTNELYILFALGDKGKRLGNVYKIKIHSH